LAKPLQVIRNQAEQKINIIGFEEEF